MQDLTLNLNQRTRLTLNLSQNRTQFSLGAKLPNIKTVEVRINTTEYWNNAPLYIPAYGTIIVYTDYRKTVDFMNVPAIKIGDGSTYLLDLPFISDDLFVELKQMIAFHITDELVHVTEEQKEFWDNKLNCDVDGEILIFNRN